MQTTLEGNIKYEICESTHQQLRLYNADLAIVRTISSLQLDLIQNNEHLTNHVLSLVILGYNFSEDAVRIVILSADVADTRLNPLVIDQEGFDFLRNCFLLFSVHLRLRLS